MAKKTLSGEIIVAHPNNPRDNLQHSVILIVKNTDELTFGIQINRPLITANLTSIGEQIGIPIEREDPIYFGGKLHNNKIHVIHSNDWSGLSTIPLNSEISLTNDLSVLSAISLNEGPDKFRACAGFWAWEGGELEEEVFSTSKKIAHRWELVSARSNLIFDSGTDLDQWNLIINEIVNQKINLYF